MLLDLESWRKERQQDPSFEDTGLIAVAIGTAQSAQKVVETLDIDPSFVYADPEAELYDVLSLQNSVRSTFFSPYTPLSIERRLREPGKLDNMKQVLSRWIKDGMMIIPPKQEQAFNQGGFFLFSEEPQRNLLLGHCDRSTGDHVDLDRVDGVLSTAKR